MPDAPETAVCVGCGATALRADMYGAAPELVCEKCANQIRERYDTRLVASRGRLRPPVVTSLVGAVAVALFVAVHVLPGKKTWVDHLEMSHAGILAGEVWRLVTSALLHGGPEFGHSLLMGVMHVGFNVWMLFDLGRGIEGRWGPWAMAALVLGGAVGASVPQWIASGPSVGLSGVVYALAGFLFALRRVDPVAAALMNPRTVNALITWFVVCIILSTSGTLAVGNWAHGGGAVWGFLAGLATRASWRKVAIPLFALATAGLLAAAPFLPLAR